MVEGQLPVQEEPTGKPKPFAISKQIVWEAYRRVKVNKGAAGVDGESIAEFETVSRHTALRQFGIALVVYLGLTAVG